MNARRALVLGTLTVGTLDLLDAIVFFGLRGVQPIRIPQSIASGLLGRAAFAGGLRTAALGTCLHYFISFCIVATAVGAARCARALVARPAIAGPAYGLIVYAVMNAIVVPLSAAAHGPKPWPVLLNGLLIHVFGVGIPAVLFARASAGKEGAGPGR